MAVMTPPVAAPELQALYERIAIAPKVMVALPPCVNPAPVTTTCVLTGPPRIDSVMTGVEAEYAAEMMKFAAAGPWEMSTKLLFEPGVVMVVEPGIAPPAVAVNAVPDAHEVVPAAVKHADYIPNAVDPGLIDRDCFQLAQQEFGHIPFRPGDGRDAQDILSKFNQAVSNCFKALGMNVFVFGFH